MDGKQILGRTLNGLNKLKIQGITNVGTIKASGLVITAPTVGSDAINVTQGIVTASNGVVGNLTGDVDGDVTGSSGSCTGNSATATKIASITNSNIVQLADSQTLTNKTLTAPTITGAGEIAGVFTGNLTGNVDGDVTGDVTGDLAGNADTSTKIASITNSNIVQKDDTQTLTNKTLTSPTITGTGAIAGVFTGNLTGNVDGYLKRYFDYRGDDVLGTGNELPLIPSNIGGNGGFNVGLASGFGKYDNNGSGSYSDVLYLSNWGDSSGKNPNALFFKKDGYGMRLYQGDKDNMGTAFGMGGLGYKDVCLSNNSQTVTFTTVNANLTGNVTGDLTGTSQNSTNILLSAVAVTDTEKLMVLGNTAGSQNGISAHALKLTYNPSLERITCANFNGTATLATEATNVTVSANNSTDETVYPTFVDGATGTQGLETDTGLTYNPSSGILTGTRWTGAVTGDVTGDLTGTASLVNISSSDYQTDATRYMVYGVSSGDDKQLYIDGGVTWNPSTNILTVLGHLAGNVTGNLTGNADTATNATVATLATLATSATTATLATTVTISANNTGIGNVYPTFVDGATGSQGLETDTGLTYNPLTGIMTGNRWTGAVTGDVTGNADTATLATEATNVTVSANNSTDETVYPTFVDGATGTQGLETDTGLTYNPSTGTLTGATWHGKVNGIAGSQIIGTIDVNATTNSSCSFALFEGTSGFQSPKSADGLTYDATSTSKVMKISGTKDVELIIEADNDNSDEADHPQIQLKQDGGLVTAMLRLDNNDLVLEHNQNFAIDFNTNGSRRFYINTNGGNGNLTGNVTGDLDGNINVAEKSDDVDYIPMMVTASSGFATPVCGAGITYNPSVPVLKITDTASGNTKKIDCTNTQSSGGSIIRCGGKSNGWGRIELCETLSGDNMTYGGILEYNGATNYFNIIMENNTTETKAVYVGRAYGGVGIGVANSSSSVKLSVLGHQYLDGYLSFRNSESAYVGGNYPVISSSGSGGSYPFNTSGNLVIQGRTHNDYDVVFATGASNTIRLVVAGDKPPLGTRVHETLTNSGTNLTSSTVFFKFGGGIDMASDCGIQFTQTTILWNIQFALTNNNASADDMVFTLYASDIDGDTVSYGTLTWTLPASTGRKTTDAITLGYGSALTIQKNDQFWVKLDASDGDVGSVVLSCEFYSDASSG